MGAEILMGHPDFHFTDWNIGIMGEMYRMNREAT
jgi:hypothetical protein